MKKEDLEFMSEILENSNWLLYGDLDECFDDFLKEVFKHELFDYGYGHIKMKKDFAVAYWLLISELNRLNLAEYGTSPRRCWLTQKGEKFKKIIQNYKNPIIETNDYIYKKYNG